MLLMSFLTPMLQTVMLQIQLTVLYKSFSLPVQHSPPLDSFAQGRMLGINIFFCKRHLNVFLILRLSLLFWCKPLKIQISFTTTRHLFWSFLTLSHHFIKTHNSVSKVRETERQHYCWRVVILAFLILQHNLFPSFFLFVKFIAQDR